jgi:uncharacterized iron-regulated protein
MKCKFLLMALFSISCVTSPMNSENKPGFTDLSQEVQSPLRGYWSFIVSAQVLILGEIHDNPEHHRIQAAIIRELAKQGRLDAILWEHIDSDQASLLQELTPETVDLIPEKLRWKTSGWPDFTIYRPVFLEALRTKVPQLAANFPIVN